MSFNKTATLTLALLFCLALSAYAHQHYECNHDDQEFTGVSAEVDEDFLPLKTRVLQISDDSNLYPNLRIFPYYEYLTGGSDEFKDYIQNELMPPILSLLQAALRIKYPVIGPMKFTQKTICNHPLPSILNATGPGVDADFFLFLSSANEPSKSWVAATSNCLIASKSKRPLVANIHFNAASIKLSTIDVNPLAHEYNMYAFLHEAFHALGFSQNFFKTFVDDLGKPLTNHIKSALIGETYKTVLDLPVLTRRLRQFYGCDTLEGAIMENQGGTGTASSHWERKFFPFDLMSSGAIHGRRLSEFTLAFMEGTGWYAADYSYAEPYYFGQGQGCGFIYEKCNTKTSNFDEFCTGTSLGCTDTGRGGGYCKSDSLSDGCKFYYPQIEFDCENPAGIYYSPFSSKQVFGRGAGSKCFSGNLTTYTKTVANATYCLKFNCVNDGLDTQLEVMFGTTKLICAEKGPITVSGYKGQINCPDPIEFCNTVAKPYCPRGCSGRGQCVENKCVCDPGFQGIDCAFRNLTDSYD